MGHHARKITCFLAMLLIAGPEIARGEEVRIARRGFGRGARVVADLFVKEVRVAPIRARVGDVIRFEMTWVNWGQVSTDHYEQTEARILANGKAVAAKPFFFRDGFSLGQEFKESFEWDTREAAPGSYRIRGEVPLKIDPTPFDNYLDIRERLVLLAPGEKPPPGWDPGGSAQARDPRWKRGK
jgi:hypothetical protein